jgi:two-component system OmpR family response regulator
MLGRLRLDTVGKRAWLDDKALDLNAREWAAGFPDLAGQSHRQQGAVDAGAVRLAGRHFGQRHRKLLSRLRSKLEAAGITIRTVRGLGYYLEKPDDADPQHH